MILEVGNIYDNISAYLTAELFQPLFERSVVRIERIVSADQATPEGEWYEQSWDYTYYIEGTVEGVYSRNK